jgi:hypothetical protein
MTFLAGLALRWQSLGKWRLPLIVGVLAVAALTLAYCSGQGAGATGEQLKQAEAAAELDRRADKADAAAADARVEAANEHAKQREELTDATRDVESPADARRRRGCVILRQQGRAADAAAAGC